MFNVTSNGFDIQQTKSSAKIFDQSNNWEITLKELTIEEIEKKRNNLSIKKASQNEDIVTRIFKENVDIFPNYLCQSINTMFKSSIFPNTLKLADVRTLKKGWKCLKENYRPVSIPTVLSKTFRRTMFAQISAFFDDIFSKRKIRFRKGYSNQHGFLKVIEKWQKYVSKGNVFRITMTDLSKTFDCLNPELLTVKLNAYNFSFSAWDLVKGDLYLRWDERHLGG